MEVPMRDAVSGVKVVDSEIEDSDVEEFVESLRELGAKDEVIRLFLAANKGLTPRHAKRAGAA